MAINISFDWILDKLMIQKQFSEFSPSITPAVLTRGSQIIATSRNSGFVHYKVKKWMPIFLDSSIFPIESTSEQSECSWYLSLTSKSSNVALQLCLAKADESNYYFCDIEMNLSTNDKTIFINRSYKNTFHLKHNKYSLQSFTTMEALEYFQSDVSKIPLKISCKISIQVEKCVFHAVPQEIPDFEKVIDDREFSDFTIATPRKEFKVHRIILTARSEVFSAMIKIEMREKKEGIVKIIDFDDEVIEELIRYMYCGRVRNLDRLAEELLRAADKYSINSLKSVCLEEICKKLSVENALELLTLVDYHKVDYLKAIILNFVVINIKKIDESQFQLLACSKLSNEILLKVIKLIT